MVFKCMSIFYISKNWFVNTFLINDVQDFSSHLCLNYNSPKFKRHYLAIRTNLKTTRFIKSPLNHSLILFCCNLLINKISRLFPQTSWSFSEGLPDKRIQYLFILHSSLWNFKYYHWTFLLRYWFRNYNNN